MSMKRPISILAIAFTLFAAFLAVEVSTDSVGMRSAFAGLFVPQDTLKGPKIEFNEEIHNFGKIAQNTNATTTFIIKSVGTDTLELISANPSCGCTTAPLDPAKKRLAPGQTAELKVTFDAHNKAPGGMTKVVTVSSNAVNGAQRQLRITGEIFQSTVAHSGQSMSIQGVFEGSCASCHVEKGKGELGAKLYEADCAVCHGDPKENKPGADIASDAMMNYEPTEWHKIIADGVPNTNMPAFHTKHKGPLNEEEIASLVDYMSAFKKNLLRERQMKSLNGGNTPAGASSASHK
jgi:mono/diheme cytochrome c family protein